MNQEKAEKGYTIYTGAFQGHSEVEFMILQHKVTRLEKQIEAEIEWSNFDETVYRDVASKLRLLERIKTNDDKGNL